MQDTVIKPSEGHDYYSDDHLFWTNFGTVADHHAIAVSGSPEQGWIGHLLEKHGLRKKALFVSCGNGWVERECHKLGLIVEPYGFDIMPQHISAAEEEARRAGIIAQYVLGDGNKLNLPWSGFDLIVNNGSIHHIAYLDQLMRKLRAMLNPGGLYVMMDYIGPHRNQYSVKAWLRSLEVNVALPVRFRKKMRYPHMPTILAFDPTEAIHAELQMMITRRYFDVVEEVRFGGGIAYEILNGNRQLLDEQHTADGIKAIDTILSEDRQLLLDTPDSNLFTFAILRPKSELPSQATLDLWTAAEDDRENCAAQHGGRYYPPTPMELIYNELANAEYELSLHGTAIMCDRSARMSA